MKISTVRTYCKKGKIPSIKIGRGYRILAKDFDEWCKEKKQFPPDVEIKEHLRKVQESEAKYKSLIQQSLDGIVATDFKGTLVLVNPSFCRMLGYSENELLGTNFAKYVHPDDRAQAVEDHMRQVARETVRQPNTVRLLAKDGKTVFAEILSSKAEESGKTVGVQKFIRDITKRMRLRQELETIIDLVPDALMITDFNGKIYRVNQSVQQFSGYTTKELLSMDSVTNMYYYPEEREKALALLKEKGEFHNFEFTAQAKNKLMPAEMSAKVAEIGGEMYIESLVRDVSERRKLQDELKTTKEILERAFNAVNFGVLLLGPDLQVVFANKWLKEKIPTITVGKHCHMPFTQGTNLCTSCPAKACIRSQEPARTSNTIKYPDGKARKLLMLAFPVKDSANKITQIVEAIIDESEVKAQGRDIIPM